MFTVYLIKVVWVFGVETLAFALALIKCCWVAKFFEKLFYEKNYSNISCDKITFWQILIRFQFKRYQQQTKKKWLTQIKRSGYQRKSMEEENDLFFFTPIGFS